MDLYSILFVNELWNMSSLGWKTDRSSIEAGFPCLRRGNKFWIPDRSVRDDSQKNAGIMTEETSRLLPNKTSIRCGPLIQIAISRRKDTPQWDSLIGFWNIMGRFSVLYKKGNLDRDWRISDVQFDQEKGKSEMAWHAPNICGCFP